MIPEAQREAARSARKALRRGQKAAAENLPEQARRQFARALELNPRLVEAWLWRGWLEDDPALAAECFREALRLQPGNRAAQAGLRHLPRGQALPPANSERRPLATPRRAGPWLGLALFAIVFVGAASLLWRSSGSPIVIAAFATPTPTPSPTPRPAERLRVAAEVAWNDHDTEQALQLWENALTEEPDNASLRAHLISTYVALATVDLQNHMPDEARPCLVRAVELVPEDAELARELQVLTDYLAGRDALRQGDPDAAISKLLPVFDQDPYYLDVPDLLFESFMTQAAALEQAENWNGAQVAYANVLRFRPNDPGARQKAMEIAEIASRPTPTPRPVKRIVVDISEQHFYAYEGDRLVYSWVTSTGEPGRPTKLGTYRVQSKIRNARSNVWHLWMPYWLGIYWVGTIENGIHGLPVQDSGTKLWAGYLGRRVSFGCVILADDAAKTIFDWAEMGTEVVIQP